MRAQILHHVVERHAQVFEQRYFRTRLIVVRHRFVQDAEVARLLDIGHRSENQPHGVVVKATADVIVAALRQRLVLVVTASVGELRGGNVDDTFAGTLRNLVHKAHEVLVRIAETHAASDAALEERGRARHVERNHALVLVPDVHHPVELLVAAVQHVGIQQPVPIRLQFLERSVHLVCRVQGCYGSFGPFLVHQGATGCALQHGRVGCFEFLFLRILHVPQQEDEVAALARSQFHLYVMRGDGAPAVGDAVGRASGHNVLRVGKLVVQPDERLAVGIKTLDGHVDAVIGVVVAAFFVLCLVVDDRAVYLHFARGKVSLEVFHVRGGVPQTPLCKGEELEVLGCFARVAQGQFLHFGPRLQGYEEQHAGLYTVLGTGDARVAHAVTALVTVQRSLAGLPSRRPDGFGVLIEAVSSGSVGYE